MDLHTGYRQQSKYLYNIFLLKYKSTQQDIFIHSTCLSLRSPVFQPGNT